MESVSPIRRNRALLLKLVLGLAAAAIVGVMKLRGFDARGALHSFLGALQDAGPWWFFAAMAILPALGAPMAMFVLPAVAAFGPQLGTTNVVLLALGALTVNFCLAYGLARRGLRPLIHALVTRLGYRLPEVHANDAIALLIMLRVTPGVPFVMQNFLAGLAQAPFGKYFVVSAAIAWPLNAALLIFGEALLHGKGKIAIATLGAIVALVAVLHLVRRHYERRKTVARAS